MPPTATLSPTASPASPASPATSTTGGSRRKRARRLRREAAQFAYLQPHPQHDDNGDEASYADRRASYSKGLPHDEHGLVDPAAYDALRAAIASRAPDDFETIPLAQDAEDPGRPRFKLVSPQAGLAFDLEGPDAHAVTQPPAPAFESAQAAGEMAELYWMALLRDVPFASYDQDPLVAAAVADLNTYSAYPSPQQPGGVTAANLFRGVLEGDQHGPYISQFLLKDFTFGTLQIRQRQQRALPHQDYLTAYEDWLAVQRGFDPLPERLPEETLEDHERRRRASQLVLRPDGEPRLRYMRTARDLTTYVHFDQLFEAYLNACLILLEVGAPVDAGNPYVGSSNQTGFATFGGPHVLSLLAEVATRALKAAWWQKWGIHRRLRPEAFGGRVEVNRREKADVFPLHPEIAGSSVLERVRLQTGTHLLPMAFPEGSPLHPAYGSGHATVAGACVTVLKAWFEEETPIPDLFEPVRARADGVELEPVTGMDIGLTVGGELNKLASNISIARNLAGVHWRTDYTEAVRLGEQVALQILAEQQETYNERYSLSVTTFDDTTVAIGNQ